MNKNQILKSTVLIFYALFVGQVIFLLISIILSTNKPSKNNSEQAFIFMMIILLLALPLLVLGPYIYRSMINKNVNKLKSLEQKLVLYRQGIIIKLAFIEGVYIFSVFSYFISGGYVFLILSLFLLFLFFKHKPSLEKFADDFNIPLSEIESEFR